MARTLTVQDNFRFLDWDSDFFGFGVAVISSPILNEGALKDILAKLSTLNVKLVYWASDPTDPISQKAAINNGGHLVDKKMSYDIDFRNTKPLSPTTSVTLREYSKNDEPKELENLALQCGLYSRFNVDPEITSDQYQRLYLEWLRRSLSKKMADVVFVAEHENKIVGMATGSKKEGAVGVIGLVAVDSHMQGKNVGIGLVSMVNQWFVSNGCKTGKVVTQGDNVAACKLYEKCGYKVEHRNNFFHFWIQ